MLKNLQAVGSWCCAKAALIDFLLICCLGHRVPGIISWPAVNKGPARENWDPVVTMDFLATVMDVLKVRWSWGS